MRRQPPVRLQWRRHYKPNPGTARGIYPLVICLTLQYNKKRWERLKEVEKFHRAENATGRLGKLGEGLSFGQKFVFFVLLGSWQRE